MEVKERNSLQCTLTRGVLRSKTRGMQHQNAAEPHFVCTAQRVTGYGVNSNRNSGLEFLRIIAILMIICIHAFGLVQGVRVNEVGKITTRIVNCICNMGVTCFMLISGYFGVSRSWKKIIRLEMMVIFYSFCTTGLLAVAFPDIYQGNELLELMIKSCIPVISRKHWFYTCYICLLLLSPFLNFALEKMNKKQFQGLLLTMLFLFSICPTFLYFEIMLDGGKGLVNMILIYLLGRYIRKYADFEVERWKAVLVFFLLLGLSYLSSLYWFTVGGIHHSFIKDNSIVNIGMAVMLFYLLKNVKWNSSAVNRIASHVFGIYILNVPVMDVLHQYVLRIDKPKVYSNLFPLWMLLEVAVVFIVCLLIDIVRKIVFGRLENKVTDQLLNRIEGLMKGKTDKLEGIGINALKKRRTAQENGEKYEGVDRQ